MVITTLEARKTLTTLERLVAALEQRRTALDAEQLQILQRLRQRRRALCRLLAAREVERAKPVIDLALWRDGVLPLLESELRLGVGMF